MPMDAGRFGKMIVEDNANPVSFVCLDRRSGSAAVESPKIERPAWNDDLLDRFGD